MGPDNNQEPTDIGLIQVGGGVFGDVVIHGSIDKFYAGYLGTNRFDVDGDLNRLTVGTEAGGRTESDGSWAPVMDAIRTHHKQTQTVSLSGRYRSFYV